MPTRFYVLSERMYKKKTLLKEYLEKIEKTLPGTLLELAPHDLCNYIEDVELDDAVRNTSRLLVSAMENYFGGDDEHELCMVSGTMYLRRFQPTPIIDGKLVVEDEYGKVYSLDEFEAYMKQTYPGISNTEIDGMVRMMRLWEERNKPG